MRPTVSNHLYGEADYPEIVKITRHLVDFFQWRFSTHPAGAYVFTGHGPDSEICITADTPIDPVKVGLRPAITVSRAHAAYAGLGIGDVAHVDLATGTTVYMDMIPVTMMINVLSRLPVEAERLAAYCAKQLRAFRVGIIRNMPELLYLGSRISLSPPSPAGSLVAGDSPDYEWSVVTLSIPVFLQTCETVMPLNKTVIQQIRIAATASSPLASATPPVAVAPLQGTAVNQAVQTAESQAAATAAPGALLQTGGSEAQSSQPLTVEIET